MHMLQRLALKATTPFLQRFAAPSSYIAACDAISKRCMSTSFEKTSHPEFHRHSTRYCDSNRDILNM